MAYVTGTANSLADLLVAIQNACTANGWTLSAGGVVSKGACFSELKVSGAYITIRGGKGVDGSGNLTGATDTAAGYFCVISGPGQSYGITVPFTWPATYFVHVLTAPDEVYVMVNHDGNFYQTIAFGQSAMPGLVGTGNWYCGGVRQTDARFGYTGINSVPQGDNGYMPTSLFCNPNGARGVDHELDSATWAVEGAWRDWASSFWRQPNQWNQESILLPIRVYASRPSGFVSPVLECAHARYVNIANLVDQQIITLGTDKWKVYPWMLRSTTTANGSQYAGHAIRYDGP